MEIDMLNIMTTKPENKKMVYDVDSRFKRLIREGVKFDAPIYKRIMKDIDGAHIKEDNVIVTGFGVTIMEKLSSGCKAVMLCYYYLYSNDILVNITECGENAINELFILAKEIEEDITVFINWAFALYDDSIECKVDGEKYVGGLKIYERLVNNLENTRKN